MADTIRERIIQAIMSKLAEIATTYGYETNVGSSVWRAVSNVMQEDLPGVVVFPRVEESRREYGKQVSVMPIEIRGLAIIGSDNPSEIAEMVLGDIISCLLGPEYTLAFTSGGTYEILAGDTITGATSHATAKIISVTRTSGSWAGGTAAGTLRFRSQTGTFQAENLDVGTNLNVGTIARAATAITAKDVSGGNLVDDIEFTGGGVEAYPEMTDEAVNVTASFSVTYATSIGNPYSQT